MRLFFIVLFFSSSFLRNANAQILYDASTQGTILKSLNLIYNYEFAESETLQKQIKAKYPNHPVVPLLRAIQLQWQYLPVKDNKSVGNQYIALLNECLTKAAVLENDPKNLAEVIFFQMAAHGYIAIVHNFNSENLKAANEARKAYNYVMKGFDSMDKNPEFYFSTGMYNYYVERYPIDHPIVKPIMLFLKDGSMSLGLKQIETAATKSVFSRAESSFYVSRIYLKHEMKYDRAAMFMANLVKQYPNNMIYLMKYIEALLFAKKYDEAHRLNEILKTKQGTIYQLAAHVFEGIWQEKVEKNDQLATQSYQAAIKIPFDDEYTKDYHAFAYDGLSYIALRAKDSNKARIYLKKAQSLTSYEHIIRK
jgi:hypothetical protein